MGTVIVNICMVFRTSDIERSTANPPRISDAVSIG